MVIIIVLVTVDFIRRMGIIEMSEKCSVCGELADPCLCFYSTERLVDELLRRLKS